MKELLDKMINIPKVFKIILALPVLDIYYAIFRIFKGILNASAMQVIIGILWIFVGGIILWILDLISIIVNNYPFWFK